MNKLLNNLLGMYKQAKLKKSAMIIDEILDRKDGASYNPQDFYDYVSQQLDVLNSKDIATALDSGTEEDVKKALCEYIKLGEYNPAICDYINSVNWLEEEDVEKWFSIKLSDEQAKEFAKLLTENNIKNKSKKEGEEIRVSFFLLPSSIGVAQGLLAATLSKFPDKQASTIKKAEEELIEIGWGFGNNDEEMIKDTAEELEEKTDRNFWERINKDISNVESDFLKDGYKKFFTKVRDEGHDSNNDLGGTAWVTKQQLEDFINKAQRIDKGSYGLYESAGELDIDTYHDDALVFHLEIYVDEETLDNLNIESKRVSKNKKLSSKAKDMRKKAFRKLCLKRAFHKTAGEFEEMMKLKSTDPKLISYLAKEFGVEESTVSQYTDVSENAEELYNILEQQANKYGYEWDKFEYDEYGDRIDEDDFRGDPDDLEKAVEYLKNNIDKTMFKFEYVGKYEDNYLTFSVNEKLIPTEKPVIYITNNTKNYDIGFFVTSQKAKEEDKAEGIYTEDHLTILIRRTSDEILNEIVNYVNLELPKKIEEQNKKQSSKTKAVRKQAIRTFDQAIKDDLLKGNKTWEDAGKDIRDSGWSSFSLDKEETIEMLKLTEEEIAKIDSLQQTAKEKKQIAEEYTKQYYAGKFDLETLHDKLVKIFGDVGTAFEWLRDNDEKIKRSSSTKKQAEKVLTLKEAIGKDESEFKNMEDIVDYMNHLPLNANKSSWTVEGFGGNSIDVENLSNGEKATIKLKKNFNSRYATRQNKLFKSATKKQAKDNEYMSDKEIAQQYDDYKITYLSVNGKNAYHVPNFTVELELPNVDENGKQWLGETMVINGTIFTIDENGETAFNKNNLDEWKRGNIHYSYVNMDKWLPQEMKSDIVYFVINKIIEKVQIQEDGSYQFKENFVYSKKHKTLNKSATIKHENGVYNVYSESGKCLGKGYKTKEEAEKRLKQVEYFKHKNASVIKKAKNLSEIDGDAEFMSDLEIGNGMPYNSDDYDYFEVYKIHAKNPKDTYNNKYVVVSDDGSILAVREKEEDIIEITYDDMLQELRWRRLSNRKTQPNKRTSLKQVVISKMAKSLKDIPNSVKKNILSDLVYVILTGKGSFAYKTVAKKLEAIIKDLGYGDKLKTNEDGSLPTMEIVELLSKEPKAMELAGKFANVTKTF